MHLFPFKKKIIAAFIIIGAFAGGMAPIFVVRENAAAIPAASIAQAASCPTPKKRYQEATKGDREDKMDAQESAGDNLFKAAWRIALLVAAIFLARIGWKRLRKKNE